MHWSTGSQHVLAFFIMTFKETQGKKQESTFYKLRTCCLTICQVGSELDIAGCLKAWAAKGRDRPSCCCWSFCFCRVNVCERDVSWWPLDVGMLSGVDRNSCYMASETNLVQLHCLSYRLPSVYRFQLVRQYSMSIGKNWVLKVFRENV